MYTAPDQDKGTAAISLPLNISACHPHPLTSACAPHTCMHKSCIMIINLLFLAVLSNVNNLLHPNSLIYNKVHPQTLWKPSLDSLIHIQKTDHWNSDDSTNTRINNDHINRAEERVLLSKEGHTSRRTLKKRTIYRKTDIDRNLHKLIAFHTILTMTILSAKKIVIL